jgi:pimeloyl-ACP methyl ester carboxylesterase
MRRRIFEVDGLHVEVDFPNTAKGTALVAHGAGGSTNDPSIVTMRRALIDAGFASVVWDMRHTWESRSTGGCYRDMTATNCLEDFETVAAWTKKQEWFQTPYLVGGYSAGGFFSLLYALRHPAEVAGIFPFATVYSGPRWWVGKQETDLEAMRAWKRTGVRRRESTSRPGIIKELGFGLMEDYLDYDVLMDSDRIAVPVCLAVGTLDTSTPPAEQRLLRDALGNARTSYLEIDGMPHTPVDPTHLDALAEHLADWLRTNFS